MSNTYRNYQYPKKKTTLKKTHEPKEGKYKRIEIEDDYDEDDDDISFYKELEKE